MVTNDILAYPAYRIRRRLSDAERRRIIMRDGFAWAVVGLIHLIIFLGLVISLQQARVRPGSRNTVEQIFDLSLIRRNRTVPLNLAPPEPNESERDISAKPLTVIPPKAPVIEVAPAVPPAATPGDVLNSIGQYLACSAGVFEYLDPRQQARCLHQPWQGLELPNGIIVLNPLRQEAAPGLQVTGADALRRQTQTAPNCPILLNRPCLQDMFSTGNAPIAPGIPDPH
ncbi:MAG TPA: hypothetical protein VHM27_06235 [Rhizomicrobium sp.]|nr:hypothetical protein [Rhizomicrobium sp.]